MEKPKRKRILRKTAPQARGKVVRQVKRGKKSQAILLTTAPLSLGQQLQVLRKLRGWSADHLATILGCSPRLVERIELDDGGQNVATLEAMVAALGGVIIITVQPSFNPADMIPGSPEDYIPPGTPKEIAYRAIKTKTVAIIPKKNHDDREE